jgi:hypothetical protein
MGTVPETVPVPLNVMELSRLPRNLESRSHTYTGDVFMIDEREQLQRDIMRSLAKLNDLLDTASALSLDLSLKTCDMSIDGDLVRRWRVSVNWFKRVGEE